MPITPFRYLKCRKQSQNLTRNNNECPRVASLNELNEIIIILRPQSELQIPAEITGEAGNIDGNAIPIRDNLLRTKILIVEWVLVKAVCAGGRNRAAEAEYLSFSGAGDGTRIGDDELTCARSGSAGDTRIGRNGERDQSVFLGIAVCAFDDGRGGCAVEGIGISLIDDNGEIGGDGGEDGACSKFRWCRGCESSEDADESSGGEDGLHVDLKWVEEMFF